MTSTTDKQAHEIIKKQTELERALDKVCQSEQEAKLAKDEAKNNSESAQTYQHQLQCSNAQNNRLEKKLIEARDKLAESEISHKKLRRQNESLRIGKSCCLLLIAVDYNERADTFHLCFVCNVKEVKDITEMHVLETSNWEKGQSKIVAALNEKHNEEIQSQQKRIDNLLRVHASLEIEGSQCKRDLQSFQHRCTLLEKLIEQSGSESKDTIDKLLLKVNEAETSLEACKSIEKELKLKVEMLEEQLASVQVASSDKGNALKDTIEELRSQLESMHAKNQMLSTRTKYLEEEVENTQRDCSKEIHKMQRMASQKVSEMNITCEALNVAIKNEKIKSERAEDLRKETQSLHENLIDQITTEKQELSTKLEKVILDEREVGKCLMNKVQDLNGKVQSLTSEKYQLNHQANHHIDQIYNLEKVIASGELRLSHFAKQLTRSMQEQERQILKEADLKKELNIARIEFERMKCLGGRRIT